jgi:hypothetical protein
MQASIIIPLAKNPHAAGFFIHAKWERKTREKNFFKTPCIVSAPYILDNRNAGACYL